MRKFTTLSFPAWIVLLQLIIIRAPTIVSGVTSPETLLLDLSYKHYLEPSVFEEVIRASLWDLEAAERPKSLQVDISCSVLGNEKGMTGILNALLCEPIDETSSADTIPVEINLSSRRNRVTPKIMDGLFQLLLSSPNNNNATNSTTEKDASAAQDVNATTGNITAVSVDATDRNINNSLRKIRPWKMNSLDVGWNELHPNVPGWKSFLKSLQKLLQSRDLCPQTIRLDRCGLGPGACRAIGKGIINRYTSTDGPLKPVTPMSLYFCGNPDLGDSGTAALASAIRTVVTDEHNNNNDVILDTLDLSACNVGDAGAEALALALESSPGMCIRHLDLSNNKISDVGAAAIAHALLSSGADGVALESLDLSGNKDIRDQSASTIASAVGKGLLSCITLRSCHILADGAAAFGKALNALAMSESGPKTLHIDLSGNPLGVLRGKTSKGGKYSASAIKSKATATTSAYMSIIRKGIKSGLKEYGVGVPGSTAESDDEEEARDGIAGEFGGDGDVDPKEARCGIKAFANAILDDEDNDSEIVYPSRTVPFHCKLGMRRCFLDHSAADSLAAVLLHSEEEMGIKLAIDIALNPVLEDDMTDAIQGDESQDMVLRDMSERYHDALEALRASRERAAEAARAAAARIEAQAEYEAQWDAPEIGDEMWDGEEEEEWDSDADYEQDGEYDY